MTIPVISTLPSAPSRSQDPTNFNTTADAFMTALISMVSEVNTSISQMNLEFNGTYYDGAWSSASGAKTAPKIYSHNNSVWLLVTSVGDITTETPSASNTKYILIGNSPVGEAVLQTLTTTTPTWTMTNGAAATITLTGNTTITLAGEPAGTVVTYAFLRIIQNAGASGYTVAFAGATVKTEDGLGLPALSAGASDIDDFVLYTLDNGVNYVIRRVVRNVS